MEVGNDTDGADGHRRTPARRAGRDIGKCAPDHDQDRGGRGDISEKDAPVLGRSIRRNERGRRFVPADEDLEEILGRVRPELLHAKIFKHEQVDARQLLDEVAPPPRRLRLSPSNLPPRWPQAVHSRAGPLVATELISQNESWTPMVSMET
jgi:hypothetical protein